MKVLLVHNFYGSSSPSGEDIVFQREAELLKSKGIAVIKYVRHNNEIKNIFDKLKTAINIVWSRKAYQDLRLIIKKEKPDIAHFHNIWYLISFSAYYACKNEGIPVVQTLHNYRFFCLNGMLLRNNVVCEACLKGLAWRGVWHGCYRKSRLYSLPLALANSVQRCIKTLKKNIDAFVALSEFSRNKAIEFGLPADKVFVKPNFFLNQNACSFNQGEYILFIGRLSVEKGPDILVDSFKTLQPLSRKPVVLKIIGSGPLKHRLEKAIKEHKIENIELLGKMDSPGLIDVLRNAKFVVVPSRWYESFSLVIVEAFSFGKPIVASRIGSLAEIIQDKKTGLLFEPNNPIDLAEKIKWLLENEDACIEMGKRARKEFEEKYTAERNYKTLMHIYDTVLKSK